MPSLQDQLYRTISSVDGLGTALCVSGTELAPLPCVRVSGAGDLSLPLTETRLRNALHRMNAHEPNLAAIPASCVSVNANFHFVVQQVAQRHCRQLGVRAADQQKTTAATIRREATLFRGRLVV